MGVKESLRVMVVDDTSVSRGLVIQSLEELGIQNIVYEANGRDALNAIAKSPVHLVVSDYNMPEMDGLQLLDAMNKYGISKQTGFILLTGTANAEVIKAGQALGMNNYIRKPFSTMKLKGAIEGVFGKL
jgi:two-component system chemotaxis response regulator CheY